LNNGIEAERISYTGFGVSQPIYAIPERTMEEEKANRRVEIKIVSN
jgi:outer membrane protein OmpA-like peptidoglycan-associated protein